jgi:hypothetical protein
MLATAHRFGIGSKLARFSHPTNTDSPMLAPRLTLGVCAVAVENQSPEPERA